MARWGVSLTYQMLLASYDCTLVSRGACLVGPRYCRTGDGHREMTNKSWVISSLDRAID